MNLRISRLSRCCGVNDFVNAATAASRFKMTACKRHLVSDITRLPNDKTHERIRGI
jgi:hypothetical protein